MDLNKHFFIFLIFSLTALQSQDSYIRSMLPIRDGITYNPDNGRPFSDLTTEFFDNGQIMLKGRYSAGFANGYWSYYYQNGQIKARGRYYKAHDYKLDGIIEDGRVGKWIFRRRHLDPNRNSYSYTVGLHGQRSNCAQVDSRFEQGGP